MLWYTVSQVHPYEFIMNSWWIKCLYLKKNRYCYLKCVFCFWFPHFNLAVERLVQFSRLYNYHVDFFMEAAILLRSALCLLYPNPILNKFHVTEIMLRKKITKILTKWKNILPFTGLSFIHSRIILHTFERSDSIFRKSEAPSVEGKRRVNSREIVVKFLFLVCSTCFEFIFYITLFSQSLFFSFYLKITLL